MLSNLYLKKEEDSLWIVKLQFEPEERRLNLLFWMFPNQIQAYEKYHDVCNY